MDLLLGTNHQCLWKAKKQLTSDCLKHKKQKMRQMMIRIIEWFVFSRGAGIFSKYKIFSLWWHFWKTNVELILQWNRMSILLLVFGNQESSFNKIVPRSVLYSYKTLKREAVPTSRILWHFSRTLLPGVWHLVYLKGSSRCTIA